MTTTPGGLAVRLLRPLVPRPTALGPVAVAGAAAVGCLVLGLVDPTQSRLVPPCPFKALTGLDCPGCGTTRAMHQLFTGHPGAAVGLNAVTMLAIPIVVWWWLAWALPSMGGPTIVRPRMSPRILGWLVVGLVTFTLVRNLPMAPFNWLGT